MRVCVKSILAAVRNEDVRACVESPVVVCQQRSAKYLFIVFKMHLMYMMYVRLIYGCVFVCVCLEIRSAALFAVCLSSGVASAVASDSPITDF